MTNTIIFIDNLNKKFINSKLKEGCSEKFYKNKDVTSGDVLSAILTNQSIINKKLDNLLLDD